MARPKGRRPIAENRRARHDYELLEKIEAGIALEGTEVKSVRAGKVQLKDSYVEVRDGDAYLLGCHISPYSHGNIQNHDPERPRRLLMHRREIDRIESKLNEKGLTLPALRMYWKNRRVKVELGLGRGKAQHDKRESLKKRVQNREAQREMARFNQK